MIQKDKILKILFSIFIIAWTCFWLRNRYIDVSNHLEETKKLFGKSFQEKWKYIFGDELYQLLSAAERFILPYEKIAFVSKLEHFESVMSAYFLYPRRITGEEDANFIIVYRQPFLKDPDGKILYDGGPEVFILKK